MDPSILNEETRDILLRFRRKRNQVTGKMGGNNQLGELQGNYRGTTGESQGEERDCGYVGLPFFAREGYPKYPGLGGVGVGNFL